MTGKAEDEEGTASINIMKVTEVEVEADQTFKADASMKWRVLGVEGEGSTRHIVLISEEPIKNTAGSMLFSDDCWLATQAIYADQYLTPNVVEAEEISLTNKNANVDLLMDFQEPILSEVATIVYKSKGPVYGLFSLNSGWIGMSDYLTTDENGRVYVVGESGFWSKQGISLPTVNGIRPVVSLAPEASEDIIKIIK